MPAGAKVASLRRRVKLSLRDFVAGDKNSGDQTEQATPKKLRDARKKGEVSKSRDLSSTAVLVIWLALGALLWRFVFAQLSEPFQAAFESVRDPSVYAMKAVGVASAKAFVLVSLALLAPAAAFAMLVEFAQVGPVLTFEKMRPQLDRMSPAEGLKRMFSADNLFEVGKSLLKAAAVVLVVWAVVGAQFPRLAALPQGGPEGAMSALGAMMMRLLATTVAVFALVAGADVAYQRFTFAKKMRMSKRDLRQEGKEAEGDPMLKARRRQLHQEWSSRNVVEAARGATALVMNPTHVAVALAYDPEEHPAPVVTAKGLGALALEMRSAAEDGGVPVIRNIAVARALNERAALDDVVPADLFAAVAEVIVYARRMRTEAERAAMAAEAEAGASAGAGPA